MGQCQSHEAVVDPSAANASTKFAERARDIDNVNQNTHISGNSVSVEIPSFPDEPPKGKIPKENPSIASSVGFMSPSTPSTDRTIPVTPFSISPQQSNSSLQSDETNAPQPETDTEGITYITTDSPTAKDLSTATTESRSLAHQCLPERSTSNAQHSADDLLKNDAKIDSPTKKVLFVSPSSSNNMSPLKNLKGKSLFSQSSQVSTKFKKLSPSKRDALNPKGLRHRLHRCQQKNELTTETLSCTTILEEQFDHGWSSFEDGGEVAAEDGSCHSLLSADRSLQPIQENDTSDDNALKKPLSPPSIPTSSTSPIKSLAKHEKKMLQPKPPRGSNTISLRSGSSAEVKGQQSRDTNPQPRPSHLLSAGAAPTRRRKKLKNTKSKVRKRTKKPSVDPATMSQFRQLQLEVMREEMNRKKRLKNEKMRERREEMVQYEEMLKQVESFKKEEDRMNCEDEAKNDTIRNEGSTARVQKLLSRDENSSSTPFWFVNFNAFGEQNLEGSIEELEFISPLICRSDVSTDHQRESKLKMYNLPDSRPGQPNVSKSSSGSLKRYFPATAMARSLPPSCQNSDDNMIYDEITPRKSNLSSCIDGSNAVVSGLPKETSSSSWVFSPQRVVPSPLVRLSSKSSVCSIPEDESLTDNSAFSGDSTGQSKSGFEACSESTRQQDVWIRDSVSGAHKPDVIDSHVHRLSRNHLHSSKVAGNDEVKKILPVVESFSHNDKENDYNASLCRTTQSKSKNSSMPSFSPSLLHDVSNKQSTSERSPFKNNIRCSHYDNTPPSTQHPTAHEARKYGENKLYDASIKEIQDPGLKLTKSKTYDQSKQLDPVYLGMVAQRVLHQKGQPIKETSSLLIEEWHYIDEDGAMNCNVNVSAKVESLNSNNEDETDDKVRSTFMEDNTVETFSQVQKESFVEMSPQDNTVMPAGFPQEAFPQEVFPQEAFPQEAFPAKLPSIMSKTNKIAASDTTNKEKVDSNYVTGFQSSFDNDFVNMPNDKNCALMDVAPRDSSAGSSADKSNHSVSNRTPTKKVCDGDGIRSPSLDEFLNANGTTSAESPCESNYISSDDDDSSNTFSSVTDDENESFIHAYTLIKSSMENRTDGLWEI